ncbi:P2 family phage major capsid protein [Gallibacterium genomosp. 3]|uniref:P2 family phage major capsid protein n=1 Tax=Gallibacterium genomosp. 3 TaxID=505345 RepID=UPI0009F45E98
MCESASRVRIPLSPPENSILITRFDNLSLYIQKVIIRNLLDLNSMRNCLDVITSFLALDFVMEDYNIVALIENINLVE